MVMDEETIADMDLQIVGNIGDLTNVFLESWKPPTSCGTRKGHWRKN
jgi:hypothetical protein